MTEKTSRNLTLNQIKKDNKKKFGEKKRIFFDDGATRLDVDQVIQPSKRSKLISDYMTLLGERVESEGKIDGAEILLIRYALIAKHFTTLQTNVKSYDDFVDLFFTLEDGGYMEGILEAFGVDNITDITEGINDMLEFSGDFLQKNTDYLASLGAGESNSETLQ